MQIQFFPSNSISKKLPQFTLRIPNSNYLFFFINIANATNFGKNINCKIGKILDSEFGFYIELEEGGTFCAIVAVKSEIFVGFEQ